MMPRLMLVQIACCTTPSDQAAVKVFHTSIGHGTAYRGLTPDQATSCQPSSTTAMAMTGGRTVRRSRVADAGVGTGVERKRVEPRLERGEVVDRRTPRPGFSLHGDGSPGAGAR